MGAGTALRIVIHIRNRYTEQLALWHANTNLVLFVFDFDAGVFLNDRDILDIQIDPLVAAQEDVTVEGFQLNILIGAENDFFGLHFDALGTP